MNRMILRSIGVAAVLMVAGTGLAFAGGQAEPKSIQPAAKSAGTTNSVISLTGKVTVENRIHPVLTSGTSTYELLVPRYAVYEAGVKDGQTVTVKGYTVDASQLGPWHSRFEANDNARYFFVTSAVIGGKEYSVRDFGAGPRFGYGPRDGRPGYGYRSGYGPGHYGPMMGYGRGYGGRGSWGPGRGGYGPMMGYGPGMGYWWRQGDSDEQGGPNTGR